MRKQRSDTIPPETKFWAKVNKESGHRVHGMETDCWLWTGATTTGYGHFWPTHRARGGKIARAHVFSWELRNGPVPPGIFVCHKCDVPGCVNPDHLFLGTTQDNAIDMAEKGRAQGQDKTHCKYGHPLSDAYRSGRLRSCRQCQVRRTKAYRLRHLDKYRALMAAAERRRRERLKAASRKST